MFIRNQKSKGITFVEVMIAALLLAVVLIPVFTFLTNAVKDTERVYVEVVAMSRAKQIMDTMLYQIPWRAIRSGNPCRFADPKEQDGCVELIKGLVPELFGKDCETSENVFVGDGIYTSDKGFLMRARAKVVDLDNDSLASPLVFNIKSPSGDYKEFKINELTNKDADGKYNLVKKIVVQIKYSLIKGKDPHDDPKSKSLFLVGFKSNLEG